MANIIMQRSDGNGWHQPVDTGFLNESSERVGVTDPSNPDALRLVWKQTGSVYMNSVLLWADQKIGKLDELPRNLTTLSGPATVWHDNSWYVVFGGEDSYIYSYRWGGSSAQRIGSLHVNYREWRPAMTEYGIYAYVFVLNDEGKLYWSRMTHSNAWDEWKEVYPAPPSAWYGEFLGVTQFHDLLYIAGAADDGTYRYVTFDGFAWSAPTTIPGARFDLQISDGPSISLCGSKEALMYAVYTPSAGQVHSKTFDGVGWSTARSFGPTGSIVPVFPMLAQFNGSVYCTYDKHD